MEETAPTVRHAARVNTVAEQHGNRATARSQGVMTAASALGQAVAGFAEGQRENKLKARYEEAFIKKGQQTGMSEYENDLQRTGFTEFIYGGQSPEYSGALDAASNNAAQALYLQEAQTLDTEGAAQTPEAYGAGLTERMRTYVDTQFGENPDAKVSFLKNWQKQSNELARTQRKNHEVWKQQEAVKTVADGLQTGLDMYKSLMDTNPDEAMKTGESLFSLDNKPKGMSDTAYQNTLVKEMTTAALNGDVSAVMLAKQHGLQGSMDNKQLRSWNSAVNKVDLDTGNLALAARNELDALLEGDPTGDEVRVATQQYDQKMAQIAGRNTGTTAYLKTVVGYDRHSKKHRQTYADAVAAENKAADKELTKSRKLNLNLMTASIDSDIASAERRGKSVPDSIATHLDNLYDVREQVTTPEDKIAITKHITKLENQLDGYTSKEQSDFDKKKRAQDKADNHTTAVNAVATNIAESRVGESGIADVTPKQLKEGRTKVVSGLVSGNGNNTALENMTQQFGTPEGIMMFARQTRGMEQELSDEFTTHTVIGNLMQGINKNVKEDDVEGNAALTQQFKSLETVRNEMPLAWAGMPKDQRIEAEMRMQLYKQGHTNPAQATAMIQSMQKNPHGFKPIPFYTVSGSDVDFSSELGVMMNDYSMDTLYSNYSTYVKDWGISPADAMSMVKRDMESVDRRIGGELIENGGAFQTTTDGYDLEQTLEIMQKPYVVGNRTESLLSYHLTQLQGMSTNRDTVLTSLKDVNNVDVSVDNRGNIVLRNRGNGRTVSILRDDYDSKLNGVNEKANVDSWWNY